jgi:nitrous oxide reductase accessory protein NosL
MHRPTHLASASSVVRRSCLISLTAYLLVGCPSDEGESGPATTRGAQSLAGSEGAVCGMVVSEQPAPRAQVVHRDGTRLFLCGIGDLLVHLEARSPHGAPVEIYVEAMEVDDDPRDVHLGVHEWVRAEGAAFRIGDERPPLIMGEPIMVYRDRSTAESAVSHGPTEILDFDELRSWWRNREL